MTDMVRLGAAKIITSTDGTYEPDDEGEWAAVLPVYGFVGEPLDVSPEDEITWGEVHDLIDLVAWFLADPGRWWFRHGGQTPILGSRDLRIAAYFGEAITFFETPEGWAKAGGRGVCILNWNAILYPLFDGVGRVECESAALKARIVRTLRKWEPEIVGRRVRHAE